MRALLLSALSIAFLLSTNASAWTAVRRYSPEPGLQLRYAISTPSSATATKREVWIYQGGDGTILNSYSELTSLSLSKVISSMNGVVFVWPELRREAYAKSLDRYCALDFLHRVADLNALIDEIKRSPFVDSTRIVLVGVSAGSEIVTLAANRRDDIAAVITIGGGVLQLADYVKASGESDGVLQAVHNVCRPDTYRYRSGLFWSQLLYSGLGEEIARVKVPYLALVGEEDTVVRPAVIRPYAEAVAAKNPAFHIQTVPGVGHTFGLKLWKWKHLKNWTDSVLR